MGDSNDFTFCQVGSEQNNKSNFTETVPNISRINLDENPKEEASSSSMKNVIKTDVPDSSTTTAIKAIETNGEIQNGVQEYAKRKPIVRSKVPFEKGYSQMDWLKLTRTHPDLAGLKGCSNRRLITMDEVKQHKTGDSIWTVLKGCVYNISPYMKFHPGGVDMLMKASGKDCTALFNKYHAWVNADFLLEKCLVGVLDDSS